MLDSSDCIDCLIHTHTHTNTAMLLISQIGVPLATELFLLAQQNNVSWEKVQSQYDAGMNILH